MPSSAPEVAHVPFRVLDIGLQVPECSYMNGHHLKPWDLIC